MVLVSLSTLSGTVARSAVPPGRPNFVLLIADDWSWPHAGAYGYEAVRTPNFDRVAKEGVLFTHAFVAAPSCTPSRAAILTGQWHWRLKESGNLWSTLRKEFATYPDLLEEAGYFVGYAGKGWGPGRLEPGGRRRNPAGKRFESFAQFMGQRPAGRPFCFWFGSFDP
ncbi:MAG TPA: heparan N-sulfatase, partial [Planctomycetaceae bacterium]|nr:heparan N-sulfatase [Planctomycetaceae bacterium]